MRADEMQKVFLLIADLFKNFRPPTTEVGIQTWMELLGDVEVKAVATAAKLVFAEEEFFSFAKLREKLDIMTKPQLPEPAEVVQVIKRLARNSNQDVSKQPEYIQRTLGYLGGLKHLGLQTWDEWLEKSIAEKYEQAKVAFGKDELKQLGMAAERLGIE